ncbi:hypothetical protein SUGI_0278610 [Cryptomeria japonica]|nr:hypothetical protein SUGI_0278610 [Cryptomeria japonica]
MGPLQLKKVARRTHALDTGSIAKIKKGEIKVVPALDCLTCNGAKFINGEEMKFDSIILATGYKSNMSSWLKDTKFFSTDGIPNG